ncbi:MAG: hypothetical protein P8Z74_15590 [Acidobacteriota bacterium]
MYRFVRFRWSWPLLAFLVVLSGCQSASEEDLAQKVKDSESPAEQILASREYLARFSDGARRSEVARTFFEAAVQSGDAQAAAEAAAAVVKGRKGHPLNSARNNVAWTLAEKGLALDTAEQYARAMVEDARKEKSRSLSGYLDTLAYVLFRKGDSKEAEQLQKEAIGKQSKDPDMLSRLALYQHSNGEHLEALQTAASAILGGAEDELVVLFPAWLNDDGDAEETARQIVEPAVSDQLLERHEPIARGRAALLLALGNIDLNRAGAIAREALKDSSSDLAQGASLDLDVDLAQVLCARGDYAGAVKLLEPQKPERTPWDALYWYTLGHAYRLSNRPDQAEEALLQPLLVEDNRLVKPDLRELGLSGETIDQRLEAEKESLDNYDPGTYSEPLPAEGRTVLVELFTGAECNPCQSADLALDLISEYFPRKAVAILEYHVNIPGADPLATPESETRYQYYGGGGTPTLWFDGEETLSGGGPKILKKSLFERYRSTVEKLWQEKPNLNLEVSAQRQGKEINVMARVTPREEAGQAPAEGVIRVALVEKSVDYTGGNGIDSQSFVVRSLSRVDQNGATLVDGSAFLDYSIHVDQVEQHLASYLDEFEKNPPERYKGFGGFRVKPIDLDPDDLAIVVWVENRQTKAVLQASYVGL